MTDPDPTLEELDIDEEARTQLDDCTTGPDCPAQTHWARCQAAQ